MASLKTIKEKKLKVYSLIFVFVFKRNPCISGFLKIQIFLVFLFTAASVLYDAIWTLGAEKRVKNSFYHHCRTIESQSSFAFKGP